GIGLATIARCVAQTGVPQGFESITALPDKSVALTFNGSVPAGFKPYFDIYVLEHSRNLIDWERLPSLQRTNANTNAFTWIDATVTNSPHGFYRTYTNLLMTLFPTPTGQFAVGTFPRLVTDPSRTNRYNIKANSS